MSGVMIVNRRDFLKGTFSVGTFILFARFLPRAVLDALAVENAWYPGVFLGIEPDGTIIIVAHRSEMGSGIRTALPMVVADELDADWTRIKVEQAPGDPKFGDQNTDGSKSMRDFYEPMRTVGATARLMLERAAAVKWGVPVGQCQARNHRIVHSDGRSVGFGELVSLAAKQPVPDVKELRYKSPNEFKYVGHGVPMVDLTDICTGKAIFGIDASVPGMVYASIERSPVLGGKLISYDDREAIKVKGVIRILVLEPSAEPYGFQPLGGVAVIADSTWSALEARRKLKVLWEPGENKGFESKAFKESLLATVRQPQKVVRNIGDVDAEFAKGGKAIEAEYYVPHLAHASMEPPAAVAEYKNGKVTAWAAVQDPQTAQNEIAKALGIDKKLITCHVTLLGGGFGRKSKPDYIVEAALLSKKVGMPVKIFWSREDDIRHDYFHTVAALYMKATVDAKGRPTAWLQRCAFPPIGSTFDSTARYAGDGEMAQGWVDVPFDLANLRAENGPAKNHVRIGWLRSVSNIYHTFAVQSFVDELAAAAGRDRIEFFLDLLGSPRTIDFTKEGTVNPNYGKPFDLYPWETGRLRHVVEVVAEQSGWAKIKPGKGRALGFAAHRSFLTYVAVVVDLRIDGRGKITIPRVDVAVDAGRVIHPDIVKSQFEGAAVFATSLALMGNITAANGQIQQSNFHDYPVARITEAPFKTYVHLIASEGRPAGVGEPGVPPIAPAIANALFAATGVRIRALPITPDKILAAKKEKA